MAEANPNGNAWSQLSESFSQTIEALEGSVVAVYGGGRSTSSGVVWRPGVVVTTHSSLGHRETVKVIHGEEPVSAQLIGRDAGTDLAVIRVPSEELKPVDKLAERDVRAGEIVLSVGRSRLGDISASCGIVARIGSAWQTWHGGKIDRLIRPDIRLYVGQSGSALVDRERRVVGINSPALARMAIITIPAQTIDRVVDAVLERGHVPRPFLGIAMQPVPVPEALRAQVSAETEYVLLVTHVEAGGPAAQAGAMVGDLIVSVDGTPVQNVREILRRLANSRIGESIPVVVMRGGVRVDLAVTVADRD
ncbi:MAG: trypsin-like peptidase domain-containing protein [Terracidiphilus sp.]